MQDPLYKNPMGLGINMDWVNVPNDHSNCQECEQMIVTENMWQMIVFVDYEPIETRFKMCEACYLISNPDAKDS